MRKLFFVAREDLDHADNPVGGDRITHELDITGFEDVQRQHFGREQHDPRQREDRDHVGYLHRFRLRSFGTVFER